MEKVSDKQFIIYKNIFLPLLFCQINWQLSLRDLEGGRGEMGGGRGGGNIPQNFTPFNSEIKLP